MISVERHKAILERMTTKKLSYGEAVAEMVRESIDLDKEIEKIAFSEFFQGRFWWLYPYQFQSRLKKEHQGAIFSEEEIEESCQRLIVKGILYGKEYEQGMKYVFNNKTLK